MNKSYEAMTDEVMDIAEQFQADCHQIVAKIMDDDPKVSYNDATFVFIFNKMAELQVEINKISTFDAK